MSERSKKPHRRTSDRSTEINFRRLRAVAEALGDEDCSFWRRSQRRE